MVRWLPVAASIVVVGGFLSGCSMFGPTTEAEVCAEFDELGTRFRAATGFIDNALFSQADTLADVADRYEGTPSLADDAEALEEISDADETSGYELMDATGTIAGLCGHMLGEQTLASGSGEFPWGGADSGSGSGSDTDADTGSGADTDTRDRPTTDSPDTTTEAPVTNLQTVSGPGGLSVSVPVGWILGGSPAAANQQASDPHDASTFARFGGSAPPDVPLLTEIQNGEHGNPNVQNGYQRVQLVETYFLGYAAVDWEFTFVKDGVTRHALGRYWRQDGLGYVIYLSAPDASWSSVRSVFDEMANAAVVS